jgi:predicted SAM-dependent methyltransferase
MGIVRSLKNVRITLLRARYIARERFGYVKRAMVTPPLPVNADGKLYVNLGAGANTSSEFVNIDTRPMPHTHYIHEVEKLPMLASNSVDLLYASHLLEHVPRNDVQAALTEWYRVLKPGGILRFGVPHFDGLVEVYERSGRNVNTIVNQLMGQDAPYDDHHTIWNMAFAQEILLNAGFKEVHLWDPKTVGHHDFIDKTMRSVVLGDKEIVISLNIEAVK